MTLRNRKSFSSNLALAGTVAIAATFWAPTASALDFDVNGNYYGGVGFGSSGIEPVVNESGYSVTDSSDGGIQLFLGRDISRRMSVEGYFSDMGAAQLSNGVDGGRVNYSAIGASGLLYLIGAGGADALASRRGFNIYARVGFGRLSNEGSGIPFNRVNDWHVSSGLGAEYNLKNGLGVRAEFHNFDSDARVVTLNIVKRFSFKGSKAIPLMESMDEKPEASFTVAEGAADSERVDAEKMSAKKPGVAAKDSDDDGVNDKDDLCDSTAEGVSVDASGCAFTGVLEGVNFTTASADLTQQATKALDKVIVELKKNAKVKVSVQAHTDNRGPAADNMDLSRKRAETVVRYLVDVGDIDLGRMSAIGFGESRPRKSNRTPEGRKANRRVEIKTVK